MTINLEPYVTKQEAVVLCVCRVEKIENRRKAGLLPGARQRPGYGRKTWEMPLKDLAAAGLLDPKTLPEDVSVEDLLPRSRAERDLRQVQHDLALTLVKLEAAQQALARADHDATHWRKVAELLMKNGGRS